MEFKTQSLEDDNRKLKKNKHSTNQKKDIKENNLNSFDQTLLSIIKGFIFNKESMKLVEEIQQLSQKVNACTQHKDSTGSIHQNQEVHPEEINLGITAEASDNQTLEQLQTKREELLTALIQIQEIEKKKYEKIEALENQNLEVNHSFINYELNNFS